MIVECSFYEKITIQYNVIIIIIQKNHKVLLKERNTSIKEENETISVDGVNGSEIVLGSLTEVSVNGNWPTIFDATQ